MKSGNFMNSLLANLIPPKIRSWQNFVFEIRVQIAISLLIFEGFQQTRAHNLTLIDMCFFLTVSHGGGGHKGPRHNFVAVAPMIMKFCTFIKLDVFYTLVTKSL